MQVLLKLRRRSKAQCPPAPLLMSQCRLVQASPFRSIDGGRSNRNILHDPPIFHKRQVQPSSPDDGIVPSKMMKRDGLTDIRLDHDISHLRDHHRQHGTGRICDCSIQGGCRIPAPSSSREDYGEKDEIAVSRHGMQFWIRSWASVLGVHNEVELSPVLCVTRDKIYRQLYRRQATKLQRPEYYAAVVRTGWRERRCTDQKLHYTLTVAASTSFGWGVCILSRLGFT